MTFESIGSLLILGLWIHDTEHYQPTVLLRSGPRVLLFPTGASERYRNIWSPSIMESGMCFDHALVILGVYEGQRLLMWSDWLNMACWGESRRLAKKARKHIPPPREGHVTLFGSWDDALQVYSFTNTSKCELCIMFLLGPLHHATFVFLFVYLKMLWGFHWTCLYLSFCLHVAFLYKTPHFDLVWRFVMVTLHAVLRRSLGKVKAQWMVCVCVFVCVKGLKLQY